MRGLRRRASEVRLIADLCTREEWLIRTSAEFRYRPTKQTFRLDRQRLLKPLTAGMAINSERPALLAAHNGGCLFTRSGTMSAARRWEEFQGRNSREKHAGIQ